MCQWFAPTKLRVTFETQGSGKFSKEEIERIVVKNAKGEVAFLNLPTKFVLTANHQVSASLITYLLVLLTDGRRCMWIGGMHGASCISLVRAECTGMFLSP